MKTTADEIARARRALEQSGVIDNQQGYESVFGGYISGFGASLVQAGILPTVIFYENTDAEAKERYKVIQALKLMLNIEAEQLALYIITNELRDDVCFLDQVTRAMVALKLALRMYKKKE